MERPTISEYSSPADYIRDMIQFRKKTEPGFSVLQATQPLRRISPALEKFIERGKFGTTFNRSKEFHGDG